LHFKAGESKIRYPFLTLIHEVVSSIQYILLLNSDVPSWIALGSHELKCFANTL